MKISSLTSRPWSRSITQSMTGRPATLSMGLGVRWVCGRRRVPFPASGMITCMSASSVAVLEPNQVVELRRGRLEHVAVHHRLDLVDQLGRNMDGLAGLERARLELRPGSGPEDELPAQHVHRLVLHVVVLQAQDVTGLHMQDLAHIAVRARPDELVAPGFVHSVRHIGHGYPPAGGTIDRCGGNIGSAVTPKNGETACDGVFRASQPLRTKAVSPSEARDLERKWLERRDE